MTTFAAAAFWCFVQVTFVATLALVIAWMMERRSAAAAAMATASAVATIVAITLMAPAPLPGIFSSAIWRFSDSPTFATASGSASGDVAVGGAGTTDDPRGTAASLSDIVAVVQNLGAAAKSEREFRGFTTWCAALAAVGAAAGLVRLGIALRYVRRLRRGARRVTCSRAQRLFADVAREFNLHRPTALRESAELGSPAVTGWRQPVAILPTGHRFWSDAQLRAALAHELAHIVRGDVAWRLAASVAQALHFFHPLVHWLTRKLVLAQELAADELAAAAAGGRRGYLQSLSELAIRLDDQSRLRAEPIVLPAFSSHLERRIAMLRSTEGSDEHNRRRGAGALAAGLIALVGIGTTALRGGADSTPAPVSSTGESTPALFKRTPVEPWLLAQAEEGLFIVRVAELSTLPAFEPVLALLNSMAREELLRQNGVADAEVPEIHLEQIEFLAGKPTVTIKAKTGVGPEGRNDEGQLMVGFESCVVRFRSAVGEWQAWIAKAMPGAEKRTHEELEYVLLPQFAALGQARYLVAARDDRTLVIAGDVDGIRELTSASDDPDSAAGAQSWQALEGGLAALLAPAEFDDLTLPDMPGAQMALTVLKNARQLGVAFDADPASDQSQIRLAVTTPNLPGAQAVQTAIDALLPLLRDEMRKELDHPTRRVADDPNGPYVQVQVVGDETTDQRVGEFWHAILNSFTTQIAPLDGGSVQVRANATAEFPLHIMTAYEYVERTPADAPARR